MFLLAGFGGTNLRGVSDLAFDFQFLWKVQKPLHRPDSLQCPPPAKAEQR